MSTEKSRSRKDLNQWRDTIGPVCLIIDIFDENNDQNTKRTLKCIRVSPRSTRWRADVFNYRISTNLNTFSIYQKISNQFFYFYFKFYIYCVSNLPKEFQSIFNHVILFSSYFSQNVLNCDDISTDFSSSTTTIVSGRNNQGAPKNTVPPCMGASTPCMQHSFLLLFDFPFGK